MESPVAVNYNLTVSRSVRRT